MITEAIFMQRKYMKGSSRDEIRRYISDKWDLEYHKIKGYVVSNLTKMLETDAEDNYSAVVRAGENYKLNPEWRKEWTKMYGIKQKRRKRKKRPSNYPKQPRSAYLLFSIDERKKAQNEYPDKKFGDITKIVAKKWKKIKKEQKNKYELLAEKDKNRYKKEMRDYKNRSHSSDSYSSTSDSEERSKSRRRRRSRKSRSESEESKPKRRKRVKRSFTSSSEESVEKGKKQKTDTTDEKKSTERSELKASSDKTKNK